MDAYYGFSRLFLVHVLIGLAWFGLIVALGDNGSIVYFASFPLIMLTIGFLSYPLNKKIGYGANWSKAIGPTG